MHLCGKVMHMLACANANFALPRTATFRTS